MTLLREAIGGSLRRARTDRRRTLREVSHRARVSLGYLSEVERGRKEASSELLAAICEALEYPLSELLAEAAATLRPEPGLPELVHAELVHPVPIGTWPAESRVAGAERAVGSEGEVIRRRRAVVPAGVGAPVTVLASVAA